MKNTSERIKKTPYSLSQTGIDSRISGSDMEWTFWRQFLEATSAQTFCQSWLPLQCRMLKGVKGGMVLLGKPDQGPFSPLAIWPDAKTDMNHLTGAAEKALKERRGLLIEGSSTPISPESSSVKTYHIAYPIEVSEKIHGVVVLEADEQPKAQIQKIMRQLHWGASWLEIMIRRGDALKTGRINQNLQMLLNFITSAVEHDGYQASAMAFVTSLATSLECHRVSLGFLEHGHMNISAISHSVDYKKESNLVRAIGNAMEEAIDQKSVIQYPAPSEDAVSITVAHKDLALQHGAEVILTIPLEANGKFYGGLTLERPAHHNFEADSIELCEAVGALAGPVIKIKKSEDRWLIVKMYQTIVSHAKKMIGRGYPIRKLVFIAILSMVIFFTFAKTDYRVTSVTSLEGAIQRVVAAPFDGYLKEAPIRPGDLVKKGETLCLLDDRDFKLEYLKWSTEKIQLIKQYRAAMAKHERAEIRIIKTKIDQAEAQLSLINEQLIRTKIKAPFNGVIMSGDLSQTLGAPVQRGQVLFEIAPLNAYRVIAEVDERDISHIKVGQSSELVLPSMPREIFPFTVEKITPVLTAKEGRNFFRVEGRLEKTSNRLRPGMEGVGKIKIDRRKLIWIWTHEAFDWLRLQLWRWWS